MASNKPKHCREGEQRDEYGKCNPVHGVLPSCAVLALSFLTFLRRGNFGVALK
jgi:hypothetical protein